MTARTGEAFRSAPACHAAAPLYAAESVAAAQARRRDCRRTIACETAKYGRSCAR